jgi:hypothetical protein
MNTSKNYISTLTLRNMLYDMHGRKNSVGFRFRLLGEMWRPNFMRIVKITERGAIFSDDQTKEFVFVADLADVVQFEIDDRLMEYHYEVAPA